MSRTMPRAVRPKRSRVIGAAIKATTPPESDVALLREWLWDAHAEYAAGQIGGAIWDAVHAATYMALEWQNRGHGAKVEAVAKKVVALGDELKRLVRDMDKIVKARNL